MADRVDVDSVGVDGIGGRTNDGCLLMTSPLCCLVGGGGANDCCCYKYYGSYVVDVDVVLSGEETLSYQRPEKNQATYVTVFESVIDIELCVGFCDSRARDESGATQPSLSLRPTTTTHSVMIGGSKWVTGLWCA